MCLTPPSPSQTTSLASNRILNVIGMSKMDIKDRLLWLWPAISSIMKHLSISLFILHCVIEDVWFVYVYVCFAGSRVCVHCALHVLCGLIDSEWRMHYLWTALSVCLLRLPDNVQPTKEFIYISEEPANDSGFHLKRHLFQSVLSFLSRKASFSLIYSWIVRSIVNNQCCNSCLFWTRGIWY